MRDFFADRESLRCVTPLCDGLQSRASGCCDCAPKHRLPGKGVSRPDAVGNFCWSAVVGRCGELISTGFQGSAANIPLLTFCQPSSQLVWASHISDAQGLKSTFREPWLPEGQRASTVLTRGLLVPPSNSVTSIAFCAGSEVEFSVKLHGGYGGGQDKQGRQQRCEVLPVVVITPGCFPRSLHEGVNP